MVLTERTAPAVKLALQQIESTFLEPLPFEVQIYTESLEAVLFNELVRPTSKESYTHLNTAAENRI